jgi:hypothetical protein
LGFAREISIGVIDNLLGDSGVAELSRVLLFRILLSRTIKILQWDYEE